MKWKINAKNMENKMETTIICWGNIEIMENKIETTIICWGNIGIMENKMETNETLFSAHILRVREPSFLPEKHFCGCIGFIVPLK